MNILIHPTYFPSISHYVAMMKAKTITFEVEDNFQKQSNGKIFQKTKKELRKVALYLRYYLILLSMEWKNT